MVDAAMEKPAPAFDSPDALARLESLFDSDLDRLDYGVIGFDAAGIIRRYNATESRYAGLAMERVLGQPIFTSIAQCMNNFLVAQRFEDAKAEARVLDATIDYVLTWKMRPTPVRLRMLCAPGAVLGYVLIERRT